MARKVFISYRRDDAKAEARSLYQHFQGKYGRDGLFMDVDSIEKGQDFTKVLGKTLADTAVMLVVMGRSWLHQQDENGRRRLDDPADYVRLEIAHALRRNIPVIPIRVDGARLPRIEELPEDIKELSLRQGTSITHENFDSDVRGLEDDLARLIVPAGASSRRTAIVASLAVAVSVLAVSVWAYQHQRSPAIAQKTAVPAATAAADSEAEVRRRIEIAMREEARLKAEAARALAEAEARREAERATAYRMELARLEAEAEALRKDREKKDRERQAANAAAEKAAEVERQRTRSAAIAKAWTLALKQDNLEAYLEYLRQ